MNKKEMDKDKKDLIKFSIIMGTLAIIALIVIFSSYTINIANSKPTKVVDPYHDHVTSTINLVDVAFLLETHKVNYASKDGKLLFLESGKVIRFETFAGGRGSRSYITLTQLPKYSGAYPIEYSQVEAWR